MLRTVKAATAGDQFLQRLVESMYLPLTCTTDYCQLYNNVDHT